MSQLEAGERRRCHGTANWRPLCPHRHIGNRCRAALPESRRSWSLALLIGWGRNNFSKGGGFERGIQAAAGSTVLRHSESGPPNCITRTHSGNDHCRARIVNLPERPLVLQARDAIQVSGPQGKGAALHLSSYVRLLLCQQHTAPGIEYTPWTLGASGSTGSLRLH